MPAKRITNLPDSIVCDLRGRIGQSIQTLRHHGIKPGVCGRLLPFVEWTPSGAYFNLPEVVERALVQKLGEQFQPLPKTIGPPDPSELRTETERLIVKGRPN